jgi:hypothetical protein
MLFFDWTTNLAITVTGPVPFSHAALAPMWTPPISGLPSGAFNPLTVTTWLRNGSSGDMIGLNSKLLPAESGCHCCGKIPLGT